LHSVHDDDLAVIVDLIDHPVVPASGRPEPGQLANQGLANPSWALSDRTKDRLDRGIVDLAGMPVEVPWSFRG
jgi:hypothetical protein